MSSEPRQLWVWTDFETTSFDPLYGKPLEAAVLVTDAALQPLGTPFFQVIRESNDFVDIMKTECDPAVVVRHDISGLWEEVENFGSPVREVERLIVGTVHSALLEADIDVEDPKSYRLTMAGMSVSRFHKVIVKRFMPSFHDMLAVEDLDTSAVIDTAEIYFPDLMPRILGRGSNTPQRALPAVRHHLRTYAMFVQYVRGLGDIVSNIEDEFDG